jgi:hypothetical protein
MELRAVLLKISESYRRVEWSINRREMKFSIVTRSRIVYYHNVCCIAFLGR